MSIQIIDGFKLNVAKPVDDRLVTSGTSSRNSIAYKYEGLRVFDISNRAPYVWLDGGWKKESEAGPGGGSIAGVSGTVNKVVKFIDTDKIGDSSIFDNGSRVGIGTTSPDSGVKLDVNGNVKATSFQGLGTYITDINATNISAGTLNIARIQNGSANQVLAAGTNAPQWVSLSSLVNSNPSITNDTTSTGNQYVNFTSAASGTNAIKASSDGLIFNPSSGQLLLKDGTAAKPAFSFNGASDTGIYRISGESSIGFSTSGAVRAAIKSDGKVGIGTSSPKALLHIFGAADNTDSTSISTGQLMISDTETSDNGLIFGYVYYPGNYEYARIQARASDGAKALVMQGGGGLIRMGGKPAAETNAAYYYGGDLLDVNGSARVRGVLNIGNKTNGDSQIEVGSGRTSNGNAYIDFIGTANEADYDFRIIRGNAGANAVTYLTHKGTGNFEITAENAASIYFKTSNTERVRITAQGILAQNGSATAPTYYFGSETQTGIYRPASNTIGFAVSGTERVRIYNEGIDVSANGAVLKLKATTLAQNTYIEFYGKGNLSTPSNIALRSAYAGFENSANNNFTIYNARTDKYITIGDSGINLSGEVYMPYRVSFTNSGSNNASIKWDGNGSYFNNRIVFTSYDSKENFVMFNSSVNDSPRFRVQNNSGLSYIQLCQFGSSTNPNNQAYHTLGIVSENTNHNFYLTMKNPSVERTVLETNMIGAKFFKILICKEDGPVAVSNYGRYTSNETSPSIAYSSTAYGASEYNLESNFDLLVVATYPYSGPSNSDIVIELDYGGSSKTISRALHVNTATAIIPAGVRWRISIKRGSPDTGLIWNTTIYKIGMQ